MSDPFGERVNPPSRAASIALPRSGEMSVSKPALEEIYPVTPQYMMRMRYNRTYFQFVSCIQIMLAVYFDLTFLFKPYEVRTRHCSHDSSFANFLCSVSNESFRMRGLY